MFRIQLFEPNFAQHPQVTIFMAMFTIPKWYVYGVYGTEFTTFGIRIGQNSLTTAPDFTSHRRNCPWRWKDERDKLQWTESLLGY